MLISISVPQQAVELMHSTKMPMTASGAGNTQAMSLQGMELSTLPQSQDDIYATARQVLASNSHLLSSPEPESYSQGDFDPDELLAAGRQLNRSLQQSSDAYGAAAGRVKRAVAGKEGTPPHIGALEDFITSIHEDYQKNYAKINEAAAEFMKDVNTGLGKISDFISAGKDGKIHFKPKGFMEKLSETFEKYTSFKVSDVNDYYNWSPDDNSTKAICTFKGDNAALSFWQNKLGDGYIVKRLPSDGKIQIFPNLSAIRNVYLSIAKSDSRWGGSDMQSQSFQSLQTAIDSQKSSVNSSVSQLLERFRQDNSTFETMIQLLTKMTEDLHRYNAGYIQ
ncbi:IpaD/SipD/SspD family type III secretion system needle tip protein [Yersinia hibernica]|uniref:IpaD/SipD/SspD family type III secretion system needle tip protein n=1 Tax=Yersinia hibernica TaxID=2339259 RepID=UPI0016438FB3|nr:IpaD/SipD/SspD family type III secretion system needle tip protein [Yersinia hibernica]